MTVSAEDATFGAAAPAHLETIVANNIAMAKETEGLDLPPAVVHKGVQAVLDGSHGAQARAWRCDGRVRRRERTRAAAAGCRFASPKRARAHCPPTPKPCT
jgi:hypothetical protein